MRRLVQGAAPAMVLELGATGPGLPLAGIKVAVLIWSASAGGGRGGGGGIGAGEGVEPIEGGAG